VTDPPEQALPPFELIRHRDLTAQSLRRHPAWAQYYEPGDVESLAALGYDREEVRAGLEACGWSDDFWFPIPSGTPWETFQFEVRLAHFSGAFEGQRCGYIVEGKHSIGLFGRSNEWIVNLNLLDVLEDELPELREDLDLAPDSPLLPLEVWVPSDQLTLSFGP
jgi:hypothetical protein